MLRARREDGFTVSEILVAATIIGIAATVTVPTFGRAWRSASLSAASRAVADRMVGARADAVFHRRRTAVVFDRTIDGWLGRVAVDGDGDGVRRRDLATGRDRFRGRPVVVDRAPSGIGVLRGPVPDPSGRGELGADPIRAGRGDIVTFTPDGTARAASVYLTDGRDEMRAVRVLGTTGRVRMLRWRRGDEEWRRIR